VLRRPSAGKLGGKRRQVETKFAGAIFNDTGNSGLTAVLLPVKDDDESKVVSARSVRFDVTLIGFPGDKKCGLTGI
jgi:hypothetical protein